MSGPSPTALEVAELRGLVRGREDADVLARLKVVVEALVAGSEPSADDAALVARIRHEYGHELAELTDPEA